MAGGRDNVGKRGRKTGISHIDNRKILTEKSGVQRRAQSHNMPLPLIFNKIARIVFVLQSINAILPPI
jgi:hypothetical protein